MIWYHQPYDSGKNIGKYYNAAMDRCDFGDWCCFTDADAMFTTSDYGSQIERILATNPEYSLLYSVANRIGCRWQQARVDWSNDQIGYHRNHGRQFQSLCSSSVEDVTFKEEGGSGFLILVRKDAWLRAGKFREDGMLAVDWDFFQAAKKAGIRIGLMRGIYLYHWYRGGNSAETSHLL